MVKRIIYTPGGTVQSGNGVYISRPADKKLLQLCREREFAYVLTSRQMGKSSLMIHTARQLSVEKTVSIIVDLTDVGVQDVTADLWYRGFLLEIEDKLDQQGYHLETDVYEWWQNNSYLTLSQRFIRFFKTVVLKSVTAPVLVFVDEIDTTLSLSFTDDFFISIRSLYNARSQNPILNRLSFVLIGVATPNELIKDSHRTPFNIGQRVDLTDFTLEEARVLADGLELTSRQSIDVLEWIMSWTNGHPYLTQRVFQALSKMHKKVIEKNDIDTVVKTNIMGEFGDKDNNLQFVQDMLLKRAKWPKKILNTYKKVWHDKEPVLDTGDLETKSHLKLSGIVRKQDNRLKIRNKIYYQIFNDKWIRTNYPFLHPTWSESLIGSLSVAIFVLVLSSFGSMERLELNMFDRLVSRRPAETLDPRLLVVTIDSDFIRSQPTTNRLSSVSDEVLGETMAILQTHNPRVIGIDLFRDFPGETEQIANQLSEPNVIAIAQHSDKSTGTPGIPPPPEVFSPEGVGFSDLVVDLDGTVRRQLLVMEPPVGSPTTSSLSFSLLAAAKYLHAEDLRVDLDDNESILEIGEGRFRLLRNTSGGYSSIDSRGYQVLVNYRSNSLAARNVPITDILEGDFDDAWVKDKIVLIGISVEQFSGDFFKVPISPRNLPDAGEGTMISAVNLQAHLISHILDVAEGTRPSFSFWSNWVESLWMLGWCIAGGMTASLLRLRDSGLKFYLLFTSISCVIVIPSSSIIFMIFTIWIPFAPQILGYTLTNGCITAYSLIRNSKTRNFERPSKS